MDFSKLQSRVNTPYIPPHRTQLHPRMHHPNPNPNPNFKVTSNRNKLLLLLASLFTIPSLYCLFSTARKLHQSAKFVEPNVQFYGIVIDAGLATARLRVFKFLGDGQMPFVDSTEARGDLDRSIQVLVGFAKKRVPKKEWANTRVQLMLNNAAEDRVLEQCRGVLRASGFAFKDAWARVLKDYVTGGMVCLFQRQNGLPVISSTRRWQFLVGRTSKFWEDIWLAEAAFVGGWNLHFFRDLNDKECRQCADFFHLLEGVTLISIALVILNVSVFEASSVIWRAKVQNKVLWLERNKRAFEDMENEFLYGQLWQEKGMYAWIATNYALGTLGGEPQETIGIVELGGTSLQVFLITTSLGHD
ncbi:hypothetical protein Pint_31552 [Pistacia integerrima]|uniref:Uncharacterized protein n=1 Tax=Pistacia integerrima TaxID=434235 RepID=A0ACC0XS20_9ROSI|nr:hypothetical protein Pint_31552 [Pistacia integerrima]